MTRLDAILLQKRRQKSNRTIKTKVNRTSQKSMLLGALDDSNTYLIGIKEWEIQFKRCRNVVSNENEMCMKSRYPGQNQIFGQQISTPAQLSLVAFLWDIVNEHQLRQSAEASIKDKNWFQAIKAKYNYRIFLCFGPAQLSEHKFLMTPRRTCHFLHSNVLYNNI